MLLVCQSTPKRNRIGAIASTPKRIVQRSQEIAFDCGLHNLRVRQRKHHAEIDPNENQLQSTSHPFPTEQ